MAASLVEVGMRNEKCAVRRPADSDHDANTRIGSRACIVVLTDCAIIVEISAAGIYVTPFIADSSTRQMRRQQLQSDVPAQHNTAQQHNSQHFNVFDSKVYAAVRFMLYLRTCSFEGCQLSNCQCVHVSHVQVYLLNVIKRSR